ncbi:MAG: DUF4410 domain-containing protein [Deltaproteobacteria bacterium]|nr:DUF4410 domain-containing protein [Deltaproteobacteria bacterium]
MLKMLPKTMEQKPWRAIPAVLMLTGLLGGCAQTTVQPQVAQWSTGSMPRPNQVIVFPFAVNADEVTENQGIIQRMVNNMGSTTATEREQGIGHDAANALADEMVQRINALGLPAQKLQRNMPVPANSLIIDGRFLDINEGNRLQRAVIGFGLGQSTMDTEVQVYGPSNSGYRQLLEFKTHADSGEMPGAAVTGGVGAAASGGLTAGVAAANIAVSGVKGYMSSVGPMASRSAKQAVEYMQGYFIQNGWIAANSGPSLLGN